MLEHDEVGSASTFPPPPPPSPLLPSLPPPPPQPAAAIASTANSVITPTALKLRLTLPPPSPVCATGVRSIGGVSGLGRSDATSTCGNAWFPNGHSFGSSLRPDACDASARPRPWRGDNAAAEPRTMGGAPKWRNWQTRRTQNPVPFGECGFDSHLR